MLHAVIMAGGSGTRFWPLSRAAQPKQLLKLFDDESMIQATVARLNGLVDFEHMLIVTNASLVDVIAKQLPELPAGAILGEPCKRDTAPCIGLAANQVRQDDKDATMVVMPSDHVIRPLDDFQRAIQYAAELVEQNPHRLVTFGIRPSYPAESFGYIERGEPLDNSPVPTFSVEKFREKPQENLAKQYFESGRFYWNSGIFVWKATTIMQELRRHEPQMVEHLRKIATAMGTGDYPSVLESEFAAIHGKSIDYAVLEHAEDVVVVEAPFTWDDVGSWQAVARLHGGDEAGNTIVGRHIGLNTKGAIVRTDDDHLVVTLGMRDCVVVHTPNATLVANRHDEEAVRQVVQRLEENNWNEFL